METYLLEINMISAQGLKPLCAANNNNKQYGPMQAYAIAWIDPAFKLRTSVDRVNRENPCWNDKFLFRVTDDFLSSETAAVNIEIYSAGYLKDKDTLIGTVRFLIGNHFSTGVSSPATGFGFGSASFTAVQVRRPSGRFHGAFNIGTMVISASDISIFTGISSSTAYRDIMSGDSCSDQQRHVACISTSTSSAKGRARMTGGSPLLCGLRIRRQKPSESVSLSHLAV